MDKHVLKSACFFRSFNRPEQNTKTPETINIGKFSQIFLSCSHLSIRTSLCIRECEHFEAKLEAKLPY